LKSLPRIGVISGRYPPTRFNSIVNHRIYCSLHGYTYINCAWPTTQTNPYMNKLAYIKEYYGLFDYLFWLDDDAFFLNLEWRLEEYLPRDLNFLSICRSPSYKELKTYFSSGQFILSLNDTGRAFVDKLLQLNWNDVRSWWPHDKYFFTGGDQDKMTYLVNQHKDFLGRVMFYDHSAFNSRPEELLSDPHGNVNVLHFTGTVSKKRSDYKKVQCLLGRGASLLPKELEKTLVRPNSSWLSWIQKSFLKICGIK